MISNFIVQNWLESTAVIFAILYLILAVKQNILCWTAGIISSVLYFFIMQKAGLYMAYMDGRSGVQAMQATLFLLLILGVNIST